jgi:hypothetical protein
MRKVKITGSRKGIALNKFRRNSRLLSKVGVCGLVPSLILVLIVGCASMQKGRNIEPRVIVVRNNSAVDLNVVSLREVGKSDEHSARLGSVSPVSRGVSQVFVRPAPPPPLPDVLDVSWTDSRGRKQTARVSLKEVLNNPSSKGDVLIFEIRPLGRIDVYLEDSSNMP